MFQLFPDHLSFHWPLHRTFILLLIKFLNKMGENEMRSVINQLDIKPVEMKQLMFAPLHLLCRVNEITNNLWLRNGTTVMQQALTYMQPHFSHSLVDADILFVQVSKLLKNRCDKIVSFNGKQIQVTPC